LGNFLNRTLQESVILLGLNDTCEELLISLAQVSVCAVKRARNSSGRRITHPATVAPAGSNRSVRSGQLLRAKPSVQKVAEKAISEHAGHNMSERRVSLEKRNVNAELVRNKRRPPSLWEASDKSTAEEHRGNGDGMCAKEACVNTGSPMPRARAQPEAREGETGRYRVAERSVIATKRVTTVERRGLTFRATMERLKRSAIGQRPSNQNSVWYSQPRLDVTRRFCRGGHIET
jgi:hypothetical protein